MNEDFEEESFDKELDELELELGNERHMIFHELYNDLKELGMDYINFDNNGMTICRVYEALIHFILREQYEKCAFIKQLLQQYQQLCILQIKKRIQSHNHNNIV